MRDTSTGHRSRMLRLGKRVPSGGCNVIAVVAEEHFRAPGEAFELVVTQRLVAQHHVHSRHAALAFRDLCCRRVKETRRHGLSVLGLNSHEMPGSNEIFGCQVKICGQAAPKVKSGELAEIPDIVRWTRRTHYPRRRSGSRNATSGNSQLTWAPSVRDSPPM